EVVFDAYRPHRGEIPDDVACDAVVVTGSEFHVYDDREWLSSLSFYVRSALKHEIPVLGICFGHQVLADTLGGTVERREEREMGFREIECVEDSPLLEGVPDRFVSFTSHQDHVESLPDESELLARNDAGIQAFRSRIFPAYGIQFHPEYDLDMASTLLERKDLDDDQEQEIRSTLTEENMEAALGSRRVLDNFFTRIV
ncbi:MAG: type 1 glutamine amidotransferase, partial [Candidatus Nanohaloarchaea archaeon]|nr:type 1 glutamine amidotransferase [Candidatus Nanohaloarchaea archaeon]